MLPRDVACYLINLDRSPQRLATMQVRLAALAIDYQRVPAIDGAQLSRTLTSDLAGERTLARVARLYSDQCVAM